MTVDEPTSRVVLLTSDGLRHRYVANALSHKVQLVGVVYEGKSPVVSEPERLPPEDQQVLRQHLDQRNAVESRLLGSPQSPAVASLSVARGESNGARVFDWVRSLRPDYVVLYGTSIIKPPLLDAYSEQLVNIHLGLSPYYRGSGTNFWPLVDGRPEFVGATLHRVAAKVDAGDILAQVRPEAEIDDRAHELGTKTIIAAAAALPRVLAALTTRHVQARTQDLTQGRVFRRRDFNADAVRQMWRNFDHGMMAEYLAQQQQRLAAAPIVELEHART